MSYRLYLFDAGDSANAVAAAHAWLEAQERAVVAGAPARTTAPAWVDTLRTALSSRHPDLQAEAVPTDAAWPPVAQLVDPEDGVEIKLYVDHVAVTVPFWHSGDRAEHVLRRVFDYLTTAREITAFAVYDPQLDAALKPPSGLSRALERYTGAARKLHRWAEQDQQGRSEK